MRIEIDRGGKRHGRAILITLDGKTYRLADAAPLLGLTVHALRKRIQRARPLDAPPKHWAAPGT
jgi:hypothetical protein